MGMYPFVRSKVKQQGKYNDIKIIACVMLATIPMILIFGAISQIYHDYNSGWITLQNQYRSDASPQYQENAYRLRLIRKGMEGKYYVFYTKIKLDDSGFYFASPQRYTHTGSRGNSTIPRSFQPLHIPWADITQCQQTQTSLITMPVKNTDVSMQLSLWNFLHPMCEQKGVTLIHEEQKDTALE